MSSGLSGAVVARLLFGGLGSKGGAVPIDGGTRVNTLASSVDCKATSCSLM